MFTEINLFMKKLFLILLATIVVGSISAYLLIPGQLTISSAAIMQASENGTNRFVLDKANWPKWWGYSDTANHGSPEKLTTDSFILNGDVYTVTESLYKSAKVNILHNQEQIKSNLVIIPLAIDSTGIEWKCSITTSANPFKRFMQYQEAKEIKRNMETVLGNLQAFLSKKDNIYGIHIERTSTNDTLFVSAKAVFATYPATPDIYRMIQKIQGFIKTRGAVQTGNPIFNISEPGEGQFQLMCAIPINKVITGQDQFSIKKMVKGSFMVAEVVGGDHIVHKASKSLHQYFEDYQKTSMAINFTMLITDRLYQTDTTKWITKLYYPVY